jgi:K+-sensing histidine kinase KdpD
MESLALAEDLGMQTRLIETNDPAAGIAAAVREDHATLIVMRHVRESGWKRLSGTSRGDALLDRLDNMDIHLVEGRQGVGCRVSGVGRDGPCRRFRTY